MPSRLLTRLILLVALAGIAVAAILFPSHRTMLLEGVWDYHFDPGSNVIDVHISRLRKKIDETFPEPILHTVRGAGYRLGSTR